MREMTEEEIEKVASALKIEMGKAAMRGNGREDVAASLARAAITALDKHRDGNASAWLHTLHMEGGQTSCRVTFDKDDAFGEQGRDYSPEYEVTSEPLFLSPSAVDGTRSASPIQDDQEKER